MSKESAAESQALAVYGKVPTAPLAIYAALLDPEISEIVIADPPTTHQSPDTPPFLGVLKVGDLPHNLALVYPRRITFIGAMPEEYQWTKDLYAKLGQGDRIQSYHKSASGNPEANSACKRIRIARESVPLVPRLRLGTGCIRGSASVSACFPKLDEQAEPARQCVPSGSLGTRHGAWERGALCVIGAGNLSKIYGISGSPVPIR